VFDLQSSRRYHKIVSWDKIDHGGRYDAEAVLVGLTEEQV